MENQEALYDLIQSIQSKMNVNTNNSNDFSNIASMLNNVDISSILGMLRQQK